MQPNPAGGPPIVPQALNRYAATALGQPGVMEAVREGYNWLPDTFGLVKGATLEVAALYPVVAGYRYVGQAKIAVQASRTALARRIMKEFRGSFTNLKPTNRTSIYEKATLLLVGGSTEEELTVAAGKIAEALVEGLPIQGSWKASVVVLDVAVVDRFPQYLALRKFSGFKALKFGLGPALDAGIGGYLQYLDDRDNPYLTPIQKGFRAGISGVGSAGIAYGISTGLTYLGCTATIYCGIVAAIIGTASWVTIGQPLAFKVIPGLQPSDRNLQPLGTP